MEEVTHKTRKNFLIVSRMLSYPHHIHEFRALEQNHQVQIEYLQRLTEAAIEVRDELVQVKEREMQNITRLKDALTGNGYV